MSSALYANCRVVFDGKNNPVKVVCDRNVSAPEQRLQFQHQQVTGGSTDWCKQNKQLSFLGDAGDQKDAGNKNEWGARERDIKGTFTLNPIKGNREKETEQEQSIKAQREKEESEYQTQREVRKRRQSSQTDETGLSCFFSGPCGTRTNRPKQTSELQRKLLMMGDGCPWTFFPLCAYLSVYRVVLPVFIKKSGSCRKML